MIDPPAALASNQIVRNLTFILLMFIGLNARAEAPQALTCDGVTIYPHLVRKDGVALLSLEHRSWILNQRTLTWGWGDVRRDTDDPLTLTAWADFWLGSSVVAPFIRTRRTEDGTLVAEVEWFDTETGESHTRTVPCVPAAPAAPTFRERCTDVLVRGH